MGGEPFSHGGKKYGDAVPASLPSCNTAPIILCRCLERTNVYCYNKAAFVLITCALCPLPLVSALLSFSAGLGGIGAAHRLCSSVIRKGREGECFSAGLSVLYSSKELPLICSLFDVWQHGLQHHYAAKEIVRLPPPRPHHPNLPTLSPFSPPCHPPAIHPTPQPDYYRLSLPPTPPPPPVV